MIDKNQIDPLEIAISILKIVYKNHPNNFSFNNNNFISYESEDISFQTKAKKVGIKSYIDKTIILGHEKSFILK